MLLGLITDNNSQFLNSQLPVKMTFYGRIKFEGKSYRLKEAAEKLALGKKKE